MACDLRGVLDGELDSRGGDRERRASRTSAREAIDPWRSLDDGS
jgi:hypothetical protein